MPTALLGPVVCLLLQVRTKANGVGVWRRSDASAAGVAPHSPPWHCRFTALRTGYALMLHAVVILGRFVQEASGREAALAARCVT
eukprot:CAMPEP_0181171808 /NCGR_PEP_ID=MMETSP1096-20121128/2111_1 /TAXON_ID=156174 ORGANISM="Chrysochromulina ericina, Strain CCMP281" /NCGR_SAMPLE_ID=MMETSP1096 /ASSEMBLY_ACC=CAM_ASM_000453 /LENGTH=84 /DNA_ID=CAMNT_0023259489 /DNA_START=36 /DNA_END=290 /DNA_ORIENTATION=+